MSVDGSANIVNSPVNVFWRIEASERLDVSTVTSFDGTSFELYEPDGTKVIVAFDLDNASVLPTPGVGERLLEVDVLTADTVAQKATKLAAALEADAGFKASAVGTLVDVFREDVGEVSAPADVDSGITITVCRRGKNFDLGLLQGDLAPSFTPNNLVITSHQTGVSPIGLLHLGIDTLEVETVLQETTKSKLEELYKIYGGSLTAAETGGTAVFGIGSGAIGRNLLIDAGRLEFVPVNTITDDLSYNVNFMLALPVPGELVFSGENVRTLTVNWQGFIDRTKNSKVDTFLVGDPTQTGI